MRVLGRPGCQTASDSQHPFSHSYLLTWYRGIPTLKPPSGGCTCPFGPAGTSPEAEQGQGLERSLDSGAVSSVHLPGSRMAMHASTSRS